MNAMEFEERKVMPQDLSKFRLPAGFRGRNAIWVQSWWLVQATAFRLSPQFAYGFRNWILRRFGAKIGRGCVIRPTATITYPWKVVLGDFSWVGDDVTLYSLGEIEIGSHTVVSQRSYICAADHDYESSQFEIRARPIKIGSHSWIATDTYVGPGVSIGENTVIGARSSVFRDVPSSVIAMGHPCKVLKVRR